MVGEQFTNPTKLPKLPDGWRRAAIEELCTKVTSGGTPLRSVDRFFRNGTHSWFKTQELRDRVLLESEEKITDEALKGSSAKLLPKDTVLMAMYGDGKTITSLGLLATQAACNQACCAMIPDQTVCIPRFLFYALKNHRNDFIRIATGGAQRNLSGTLIRRFALNTPRPAEQLAIAQTLGTLDDKIELNRRMNETLESMARALFKSWFVDFDPVSAKVECLDTGLPKQLADLFPDSFGESEKIPKGWAVGKLGDLLSVIETGGRPKGGVRDITEGAPSVGAESIVGIGRFDFSKTKFVPREFFEEMKKGHVQHLDVLLYKDGGRPGVYEPHLTIVGDGFPFAEFSINEHVYRLRTEPALPQTYLFFWLSSDSAIEEMRTRGTGVAIPGLNSTAVRELGVLQPSMPVLKAFENNVLPIVQRILCNSKESRTLGVLRDTLLPKLISGELRLPDAERIVGGHV